MEYPIGKIKIFRHLTINGKDTDQEVLESDLMDQQVPAGSPSLKDIVGDGLAKTTASVGLSHKDYGTGGEVMVSVTLTHDQSDVGLQWGHYYATLFAKQEAERNFLELQQKLVQMGIVKGPQ